jgi:hypothetical protein
MPGTQELRSTHGPGRLLGADFKERARPSRGADRRAGPGGDGRRTRFGRSFMTNKSASSFEQDAAKTIIYRESIDFSRVARGGFLISRRGAACAASAVATREGETMTDATIGWGGKLYLQDSGAAWVAARRSDRTPFPEDQIADVEATHMLSPGRREEYIAGLIDGGTGDIVMNYVPGSATDVLCRDLVATGATRGLRIDLLQPDSTYYRDRGRRDRQAVQAHSPIDNRKTGDADRPLHRRERPRPTSKNAFAIELKPFYNEAQVALADGFILRLVVNFRTIDRLEGLARQ